MRTTKADFERFKKSFQFWVDKLQCSYKLYFIREDVKDCFAEIDVSESGKCATIRYSINLHPIDYDNRPTPVETGKHEAIHLFLHRLLWLGQQRYTNIGELEHEWERLVRVLERVL